MAALISINVYLFSTLHVNKLAERVLQKKPITIPQQHPHAFPNDYVRSQEIQGNTTIKLRKHQRQDKIKKKNAKKR